MSTSLTMGGIDQALANLKYRNPAALKTRFVNGLRSLYEDEQALYGLKEVDAELLIAKIWDIEDDPGAVKSKLKNLNSLRSSVNADLKKLYDQGENPEGVQVGPQFVFEMSDEAKDKFLSSLTSDGSIPLDKISQMLDLVNELLAKLDYDSGEEVAKLKDIITELTDKLETEVPVEDEDDFEEIQEADDEIAELDEMDPDELEVVDAEDFEEIEVDDDVEEVIEDDIEEIEEADDEIEALDEMDPDDLEEVDEEDFEEIEVDDEIEDVLEDEIEEIEADDDFEEVSAEDFDEIEEVDDEIEEIDEVDPDEFEEVDDEDFEEVEETDDFDDVVEDEDEFEIIPDEDVDEIEEYDEDEFEEIEDEDVFEDVGEDFESEIVDESFEEIEDVDDIPEEAEGDLEEELIDDEDFEEIDEDDEIVEVDAEDEFDEIADEDEVGSVEVDDDDFEEIDEEDVVDGPELEEVAAPDDIQDIEEIDDEDEVDEIEEIDEDEYEEVDEDDIEEIDEDELDEVEELDDDFGMGLPRDDFDDDFQTDEEEQERLLAEQFDGYLGTMERFYNQYLIIPSGDYTVGTINPGKDELDLNNVYLRDFYIGKYPVTNALFEVFVERTGYKTTAEEKGFGVVYYGRVQKTRDLRTGISRTTWNAVARKKTVAGACWYQPFGPGSTLHNKRNHPVVQVSLRDAQTFAAWTGKRLPREIEWEAAARTDLAYPLPWGNEWEDNRCNTEDAGHADTTPVDQYPEGANEFAICDTMGNVLEWTMDPCDPPFPMARQVTYYIAKGGSWVSDAGVRLYRRARIDAEFTANNLGFRCVAD